jgi:hypothetical protein
MKHLSLCLLVTAFVACDAVIVSNVQEEVVVADPNMAPDSVVAEGEVNAAVVEAPVKAEVTVKSEVTIKPELQGKVKSEELDLEGIAYLVKKGKVKNAADLEKKVNNPKEKLTTSTSTATARSTRSRSSRSRSRATSRSSSCTSSRRRPSRRPTRCEPPRSLTGTCRRFGETSAAGPGTTGRAGRARRSIAP